MPNPLKLFAKCNAFKGVVIAGGSEAGRNFATNKVYSI